MREEIGGVGARHLARTLDTPTLIIGEPSSNTVRRGHRGRTELVLHLVGRSVHASVPEQGVNPLTSLEMPVYSCRAYILPLDHPAVRTAERVVNAVSGESRPVGIWEFATDGGHFAAAGMAPVGFGPGDPYLAHTVNEQIEIAEFETAIEINHRLALALTAPAE